MPPDFTRSSDLWPLPFRVPAYFPSNVLLLLELMKPLLYEDKKSFCKQELTKWNIKGSPCPILVLSMFTLETPGDLIVRKLTIERMEELRKSIKSDQLSYKWGIGLNWYFVAKCDFTVFILWLCSTCLCSYYNNNIIILFNQVVWNFPYRKLKERIEDIRSGKLDHQLPALVEDIKL